MMSLLGLVALLPGAAKKPDSPDVALTRAEEKIARLQADLEVLERRVRNLEAAPPREQQRDRYNAWAQQNYHNQQNYQGMQGMQAALNQGMMLAQTAQAYARLPEDMEEYIRNCTPGRAEVLRRQG